VFEASPLWEEPFGLNVVEALACGTPVAALPGGAMSEILGPGAGVVARDSGAEALAEAVAAARALPNEAVLRASLRFSIETMVDRYEEAMLGLVAETAAAATAHESTGEQAGETAAGP
jgi:glycosyltransferase involved in cell wall biosynthesis